jgi:hypothetical protein
MTPGEIDEAERFTIVRRRVVVTVVVLFAAIVILHYLVMIARFGFGRRYLGGFSTLMNVDEEESFSTFLQMLNLLASSSLLFVIGHRARRLGRPHALGWMALAAVFLYLSLDESTQIHEQLIAPLQRALDAGGALFFTWIVVAIPLVILFVILYVPFLRDLEPEIRRRFLLAGFLYLCGTIGMEMVGGVWADEHTFDDPVYLMAIVPVEEAFEFVGQVLFLSTLLTYVARTQPLVLVGFDDGPRSRKELG